MSLEEANKSLVLHSSNYENLIIEGDLNVDFNNSHIRDFCDTYDLKSLINKPTYYKTPENPPCIDLLSTNHPRSFLIFFVFDKGLLVFHKMIVTVMKASFQMF